ncbi:MAG: DUF4255 domain-containing protein [Proteobacteria bacterium]|nr:DUF4255 domain-containing protein [Pseudomonadota bacterium]
MSRHRIIAAVTTAFGEMIESAAMDAVAAATVQYGRPDTSGLEPKVFLYMYQVTPNAAARNLELPTRYDDGTAKQRPLLALDLHYLLTFVGDDSNLEPQKMLGNVSGTVHAFPVLLSETIRSMKDSSGNDLLGGDAEKTPIVDIRLASIDLNLEELSKVWSVFFQTPYSLSVAYRASVVLVEHDLTVRPPLPAQGARGQSGILANPVIALVISKQGRYQLITSNSTIFITGKRLRGEQTLVRFVGANIDAPVGENSDVDTTPSEARPDRVVVSIPPQAQRVAVHPVRVVHRAWDAEPDDSEGEVLSNTSSFVLHPNVTDVRLDNTGTDSELEVDFAPPVRTGQKAQCLLDQLDVIDPASHQIDSESFADNATTLRFILVGVNAGTYAVRVSIDSIASLIEIDQQTQTIVHTVEVS